MYRASRLILSAAQARPSGSCLLHTTSVTRKSMTEKVSDVADTVNKKLGKGLASAIEGGEKAATATKDTLSSVTNTTKEKASETSKVAGQKINQAESGAREAKEDVEKKLRK
ncbi:uncharacterized protein EV420DRAFT_1511258 [Desarmillaria tabescens]|uniref:Uncharacterized protein n=1 Tax=Armillaria tabescens TaxID=1929756 RepID=A0AA39NIN9_ARMTA|nr:uncharacterized protein EV420DRAFT_1511258 [Desarmillaria tabescens]KAK0466366.1 hypothetical protein EV420DRAFT_1511258 [Desarmillaria tabescens]